MSDLEEGVENIDLTSTGSEGGHFSPEIDSPVPPHPDAGKQMVLKTNRTKLIKTLPRD